MTTKDNDDYVLFIKNDEDDNQKNLKKIMKTLKTGDLLLCDNLEYKDFGLFGWLIKFMTYSDFSHIGMIVKDPQFTKQPLEGIYVWQSGSSSVPDAEDNIMKLGVQFTPFLDFVNTYKGKIYLRRIKYYNKDNRNEDDLCDETSDSNNTLLQTISNNNQNNNPNNMNDINNYIIFGSNLSYSSYLLYASNIYKYPVSLMKKTINALNPLKLINVLNCNNNTQLNEVNSENISMNNYTNFELNKAQNYHKNLFTNEKLKKIHEVVYNKPYDLHISDWIEAYCKKDPNPQKTSRFWCSALTAFIYTKLGLFPENLDWSIMTPSFFSSENPNINKTFIKNIILEKEELIACNMPKPTHTIQNVELQTISQQNRVHKSQIIE